MHVVKKLSNENGLGFAIASIVLPLLSQFLPLMKRMSLYFVDDVANPIEGMLVVDAARVITTLLLVFGFAMSALGFVRGVRRRCYFVAVLSALGSLIGILLAMQ